ncbi:hypothetical protein JCM8547_003153 [Rhodosporidiobolus lusitaniae]
MSLLRSAARRLKLGKYKYWQGTDLAGNNFFERPHPEYTDQWRWNKRYVEYAETRPLSDYDFETIPVQWSSWLRRTRRDPPTLQELQTDLARQIRLQENVHRLEQEYKAEKLRLAEADRVALLDGPLRASAEQEGKEGGEGGSGVTREQEEGLPMKESDLGMNEKAAEVAREVGTGEERVEQDEVKPPKKEDDTEELAKQRRQKEREEAIKRREEFARQNPAPLKGNPSDSYQPQGWSPAPAARRRA